ncbi:MAG: NAD(+)/NADH kinase [Actinomycetota bacterium]|nr:NAD(+)/NADH kinase [Actinomycetota bacterium]
MKLERIAIVSHHEKSMAARIEKKIGEFLAARGVTIVEEAPDLVVALGGDGTVLRGAQVAHEEEAPLLGVNLGRLGYLTEVDAGDEITALEKILAGDFHLEDRMMLACSAGGSRDYVGMNEVLVERTSRYRLLRLEVRVGGERLAAYNADGVIVATPTGSTAYALSAGGPIVDPRAQCMVLVPVSPHMIFARPFVLTPDETVEITTDPDGEQGSLSLDGALGGDLEPGTTVVVRRHPRPLRIVRLSGPNFLERLRNKLQLPG